MENLHNPRPLLCQELIGRERELNQLLTYLKLAAEGKPQLLLLAGEAGLGKSRLCQALAENAGKRQALVLFGQTSLQDYALPFGPFLDALHRYFSNLTKAQIEANPALQAGLSQLLNLLPELAPQFPEIVLQALNSSGTLAQQQYRLFQAIWNGLRELSKANGGLLLLLLEDLHWADETTLELLAFLARQLTAKSGTNAPETIPLLILASYRPEELTAKPALNRLIIQLTSQRQAAQIRLAPLDRSQHAHMLSSILGQAVSEDYASLLFERDEGNPFFIEELLGAMVANGQLQQQNGRWFKQPSLVLSLPLSLKASIMERVAQLPPTEQEVLAYASVIGREFDFDLLAALAELDERQLLAVLRRAISLQLVSEADNKALPMGGNSENERYQFRHALTREAIYGDMLARERRMRHRALAETLEKRDSHKFSRLLAEHYWLAGLPQKAYPYALQEAEHARRLLALREERSYLQIALNALEETNAQRLPLLHRLGLLSMTLMDVPAAQEWLNQAKDGYQQSEQPRRAAQVLVHLTFLFWFFDSKRLPGLVEEMEAAARATFVTTDPTTQDLEALSIYSQTAFSLASADKHQQALIWIERSQQLAAHWPEPNNLQAFQLGLLARGVVRADSGAAEVATGLSDMRQVLDFALKNSLPDMALVAYGVLLMALTNLGYSAEAETLIEELSLFESRTGLARMANLKGWQRFFAGNWASALEELRQELQKPNAATPKALYQVTLAHFLIAHNELDEAGQLLENALPLLEALEFAYFAPALWGWAKLCTARQQLAEADTSYDRVWQSWQATNDKGTIVPILLDAIEFYSEQGKLLKSQQWLAELRSLAKSSGNAVAQVALVEGEALLATAEGDIERALQLLPRASEAWGRLSRAYQQAHTRYRLAALLLTQSNASKLNREQAANLLEQAKAEYERLSIPGSLAAVENLLQTTRLAAQSKRRSTMEAARQPFQGLTRREVQVLIQICGGLTNKEIASELNISEGTVELHINHIFSKLGCESRVQAATYALEQGWVKV